MVKGFLQWVVKNGQLFPVLTGPRKFYAGERLSVIFHCVENYQIMIFQIMVVYPILSLIEYDILSIDHHDTLVALCAVIHDTEYLFIF